MKKLLVSLMLIAAPAGHALDIGDEIEATLLQNVVASGIYGLRPSDNDQPRIALTDAVIEIGSFHSSKLLNFQVGFFGNPNEVEGEPQVANWIVGSQFRIDPFIKQYVPLDPTWMFLRSIQHGPSAFYDLTNERWIVGYQVGLSFGLDPNMN